MTITHEDRLAIIFDPTTPVAGGVAGGSTADEPGEGRTRPSFTITEAASACAVSRKTITRKLADLAEFGAAKDADGVWRIPVEALLALGLHPGRSLPADPPSTPRPAGTPAAAGPAAQLTSLAGETVTILRERYDDLRIRLARAEAEAAERALALADARLALRALTAGPSSGVRVTTDDRGPALSGDSPPIVGPAVTTTPDVGAEAPRVPAASSTLSATPAVEAESAVPSGPSKNPGDPGLLSARNQAAQRGGYVPAVGAPPRKRRWWHSS